MFSMVNLRRRTLKVIKILLIITVTTTLTLFLERYYNRPFEGKHLTKDFIRRHRGINEGVEIQKNIFQTWKNHNTPRPDLEDTWREKNKEYKYKLFNDTECEEFVARDFPSILPLYKRLPQNVMRADLFRYLIVYARGGVYSDLDTECLRTIDEWDGGFKNSTVNCVVGVEFDASNKRIPYFEEVQIQFIQWTVACSKNHPMLKKVIDKIVNRFDKMDDLELKKYSVHQVTGPSVWSEAILEYLCSLNFCNWRRLQGLDEPVLINDVLVLPPTSFNPWTIFRAKPRDHRLSYVFHAFLGSWK